MEEPRKKRRRVENPFSLPNELWLLILLELPHRELLRIACFVSSSWNSLSRLALREKRELTCASQDLVTFICVSPKIQKLTLLDSKYLDGLNLLPGLQELVIKGMEFPGSPPCFEGENLPLLSKVKLEISEHGASLCPAHFFRTLVEANPISLEMEGKHSSCSRCAPLYGGFVFLRKICFRSFSQLSERILQSLGTLPYLEELTLEHCLPVEEVDLYLLNPNLRRLSLLKMKREFKKKERKRMKKICRERGVLLLLN